MDNNLFFPQILHLIDYLYPSNIPNHKTSILLGIHSSLAQETSIHPKEHNGLV
jgi:hypothetical protein